MPYYLRLKWKDLVPVKAAAALTHISGRKQSWRSATAGLSFALVTRHGGLHNFFKLKFRDRRRRVDGSLPISRFTSLLFCLTTSRLFDFERSF